MFYQLAIEALAVGVTVVIFWLVANYLVGFFAPSYSAIVNFASLGVLFATGVFSHLFFETVGLNKWYCKNGFACQQ